MHWGDFFAALGLAAVIEGILYAAFPVATKRALSEFLDLPLESRRRSALGIALFGLFILWMVRG